MHQIYIDAGKTRLPGSLKGSKESSVIVNTADGMQQIILCRLKAQGQAVEARLPQHSQGFRAGSAGVAFQCDLGVRLQGECGFYVGQQFCQHLRRQNGRSAAAKKDGGNHRSLREQVGGKIYFPVQRRNKGVCILPLRHGEKVTVAAFLQAVGNVDIQARVHPLIRSTLIKASLGTETLPT